MAFNSSHAFFLLLILRVEQVVITTDQTLLAS